MAWDTTQRRETSADSVILQRHRCAEDRHDAGARSWSTSPTAARRREAVRRHGRPATWNRTWAPQLIPKGALLEVQLPATRSAGYPTAMRSAVRGTRAAPRGTTVCRWNASGIVPSPTKNRYRESANPNELPGVYIPVEKRVVGSSAITVCDYQLQPGAADHYWAGRGLATICLRPDPIPEDVRVLGFPPDTAPTYVAHPCRGRATASYGGGLPATPRPAPPEVRPEPDVMSGPNQPDTNVPSPPNEPPTDEHG